MIEIPYPIRILKIGPVIVPVIAISRKTLFVIAISAFESPRLLPYDRIIRASKFFGSSEISLNKSIRSMMHLYVNNIQAMLIMKLNIWTTFVSSIDPFVFLVLIRIPIYEKIPDIKKIIHMCLYR